MITYELPISFAVEVKAEASIYGVGRISQETEQEDWLSKLPDDVLISVLKRLDLRDAVRSSILSRRWRHIPSVLPDIVLDVGSFEPSYDDGFVPTVSDTAWSNMALARAAKSLLGRRSEVPIGRLTVALYLRSDSLGIVRAVGDAISGRGVVSAKLKFLGEKIDYACDGRDTARNGRRFLSCFNACPSAFAGLTGLHLESVTLGESDIPSVLRTCRKLRRLSLLACDSGGSGGMVLALEHPELAKLKLVSCYPVELRWLPELAQVTCWTWVVPARNEGYPLLFGNVPRLRRLTLLTAGLLGYPTLLARRLLANCTTLHELVLNFSSERIWIHPEGPERLAPLLRNLRSVTLDSIFEECDDLTWTLYLLRAAPLLKTLRIKVSNHECEPLENEKLRKMFICEKKNIKWELSNDFKHYNLAALEIYGFEQRNNFMGYIRRVMRAAVNLEVIALNDHLCEYCGFRQTTGYPRTKKERDLIRKQINEEGLPSAIKDVQFCEMSSEGPIKFVD